MAEIQVTQSKAKRPILPHVRVNLALGRQKLVEKRKLRAAQKELEHQENKKIKKIQRMLKKLF